MQAVFSRLVNSEASLIFEDLFMNDFEFLASIVVGLVSLDSLERLATTSFSRAAQLVLWLHLFEPPIHIPEESCHNR